MSPHNQRTARKRGRLVSGRTFRLLTNGWGITIGLIAIFACLVHFFVPGPSAVDVQLGNLAHAYYIAYGIAGIIILVGLLGRHDELDALGLSLFIGALAINLAAVIATLGLVQSLPGVGTWIALTIGAVSRLLVVARIVRPRPRSEPTVPLRDAIRMAIDDTDPAP